MSRCLDDFFVLSRRALCAAFAAGGSEPPLAVDGTAGNGHDTLFLAEAVGPGGRVWAFDVQAAALAAARQRLRQADGGTLEDRVTFVPQGHETLAVTLPASARGAVRGAMFNLGFLPGSDKAVKTTAKGTVHALTDLMDYMAPGGVVSVHCYTGHAGGREEALAVESFCAALPWSAWRAARHELVNKLRNRELLFLLEKLK